MGGRWKSELTALGREMPLADSRRHVLTTRAHKRDIYTRGEMYSDRKDTEQQEQLYVVKG